jgi:hypothetical protein
MAGLGQTGGWMMLPALLLAGAGAMAAAQTAASGALTGRLTDLRSAPLTATTVIVRNDRTGAETRGTTGKNGVFRFAGLEPGEYTLEAESARLGHGELGGVVVSANAEARVQAAMAFEPAAEHPVEAVSRPVPPAAAPARNSIPARRAESAIVAPASVTTAENAAHTSERAGEAANLPEAALPMRSPALRGGLSPTTPAVTAAITAEPLATLKMPGHFGVVPALTGFGTMHPLTGSAALAGIELTGAAAVTALDGANEMMHSLAGPAQMRFAGADPSALTTTLTAAQIAALPAPGRRWQEFALDTPPGTTPQASAVSTMDGTDTRMAFGGQGSGPESSGPGLNGAGGRDQNGMGQAWAGGRGSPVAEAAIREVQTTAGKAEAEGARAAGSSVSIQTASGGPGFHGQGFIFDRQNAWGAQNPFTAWVKQTAPAMPGTTPTYTAEPFTPPDRETVLGIGLGSELRRGKLFWFAALDGYNRNDPGLAMVKHPDEFFAQPSNDQMQVLSARLGLPAANPVAEGLEAYSGMLTTLDGLLGPAPRTAAQWVGFGRVDWQAAERHRFTLEVTGARWNSPGGGLGRVSEVYGTNSFGSSEAGEELVMGRWEAFLTPNLLAVMQGSPGRSVLSAHAETPSDYEETFLAPNAWGQLPQIVVDSRYGFTIGNPSRFGPGSYPDERVSQAQETLSWVHGKLLVKSGFELSHNADRTGLLRNGTGTYSYSSVENFASDALAFAMDGIAGELQPDNQHDCDETGKVWRDSGGGLRGLGYLPCYSYYSQVIGPANWSLSTNDWAGFSDAQWQPGKLLVFSGGLRWEREQLPPPIAALDNPDLPLTQTLPSLGSDWGPRVGMALGNKENRWPVLRLGYGIYFGRTENATLETAITQTGSANGDRNFFLRPTDNLNAGGAPPFPYVLTGAPGSVVKPGAVEFAPRFRNAQIHQAVAAVEETLPGHVEVTASALVSLGRRLPISIDTNFDPAVNPQTITYAVVDASGQGPIKTPTVTAPFYASWPAADCPAGVMLNLGGQCGRLKESYQQISEVMSRANSTYEAASLKIVRYGQRGLSLHARYTYAHAMDWNPNESTTVAGSDVLDPNNFSEEYGTGNLDVRHSAAVMAVVEAPWKLHGAAGRAANGWMLSGIGQYHSGLPFTMRTAGALAEEFNETTGAAIVALAPGMNGSGGDSRVYGVGRNTYRYPAAWKADLRVGKKFDLGRMRELESLVESFNLFNHQNVTELETTGYSIEGGTPNGPPTLNFLTGAKTDTTAFGQPLNVNATNFYREREIQFGVRMRF